MQNIYLARHKNKDSIYFYAVTNIYDKISKKQNKKQVFIGRHVNGMTYFNDTALNYAELFQGSEYEQAYWNWRTFYHSQTNPENAATATIGAINDSAINRAGVKLLFDKISSDLGLDELLIGSFGETITPLLKSCVYYLASVSRRPLFDITTWHENQLLPYKGVIDDSKLCDLLSSMTPSKILNFQTAWIKKFDIKDQLSFDITSISSYSKNISDVMPGYNRDKEKLCQINLLMIVSQSTLLPVWFEQLPGAISDVTVIPDTIKIFKQLNCTGKRMVFDRGFASEENIAVLQKNHFKFTMAIPLNKFKDIREEIKLARDAHEFNRPEMSYDMFDVHNVLTSQCATKKITINGHRVYLHMFYCDYYRNVDEMNLTDKINNVYYMLKNGMKIKSEFDKKIARQCFSVKCTPVRGIKVSSKPDEIEKLKNELAGYFAIISNEFKDPYEALKIYKLRDGVEKRYDDLKNDVDMCRLRVHDSIHMQSHLFLQFLAEIYRCKILNVLHSVSKDTKYKKLQKKTVTDLINNVEPIVQIQINGHRPFYKRPTKTALEILNCFNVKLDPKEWPSLKNI